MDKKILITVTAIFLVIGASIGYLLMNSRDTTPVSETALVPQPQPQEDPAPTTSTPQPIETPGTYKDYSSASIAETTGTKLLFFHAPWCPQCRALEADIQQQGVPPGVAIIKVDYDSSQSLRQKYGVTIQTTFIRIDDQGNLVEKYVAYDEPTLESVKRTLL